MAGRRESRVQPFQFAGGGDLLAVLVEQEGQLGVGLVTESFQRRHEADVVLLEDHQVGDGHGGAI